MRSYLAPALPHLEYNPVDGIFPRKQIIDRGTRTMRHPRMFSSLSHLGFFTKVNIFHLGVAYHLITA